MNQALETSLEQMEIFSATHHRPLPILTVADISRAEALAGKRKRSKPKKFRIGTSGFHKGLSFKYRNHYRWQLDICEIINIASPGYLVHLAEVPAVYAEVLRERWEEWCKREENYIPQAIRMNFWDYWQAWVEAGELIRFKDDIFSRRSGLIQTGYTDVFCLNRECVYPSLTYQVRYTLVQTDNGVVTDMIPTVDDQSDPAGEAGQYHNGQAVIRRRCPWCRGHNVYYIEVESTTITEK